MINNILQAIVLRLKDFFGCRQVVKRRLNLKKKRIFLSKMRVIMKNVFTFAPVFPSLGE
jgi:hypothetical protein